MKKVIIYGGTGFFGKSILRYLEQNKEAYQNYSFTITSRNPENFDISTYAPNYKQNINLIKCDVLLIETLPNFEFDYVIHAANDSTNGHSLTPLERSNQILIGTRNILEWCRKRINSRLVYISSGGVYGQNMNKPLEEEEQLTIKVSEIDQTYSTSKGFAEHLCFLYAKEYQMNFTIARCFSFIGEDLPLNKHFAIGNFINDVIQNRDIEIKGTGTEIRSYLDQYDLADCILRIMLNGESNEIYNIGSDQGITIKNLASLILKTSNSKKEIVLHNKKISGPSTGRNKYIPSMYKFKNRFSWVQSYKLEQSIYRTITHHRKFLSENEKNQ